MAFLSTGIQELNDLLTRNKDRGIAIPGEDGIASSTMIIRGTAGAGKSVLASVLAANLHLGKISENRSVFVIYYSFAQPSTGIGRYLTEILQRLPRTGDNDPDDDRSRGHYHPLIVSPKSTRCLSGADGLAVLRKTLVESLNPLQIPKLSTQVTRRDLAQALRKLYGHFDRSPEWLVNARWEQVVPRDLRDAEAANEGDAAAGSAYEILPVVIVDPVNTYFDYRDARSAVAELFAAFRQLQWPLIVTLEDPGSQADPYYRQLMSYTEFEADVVVSLSVRSEGYARRTISIQKSRNSQPVYGEQLYRIENPSHSLANLLNSHPWGARHPGFLLFKSVHLFLSRSRKRPTDLRYYHSGIAAVDESLLKGIPDDRENASPLPSDSYILVTGSKGGHKLSIAFNLLIAGLWDGAALPNDQSAAVGRTGNVMLISLGEETSIQVDKIALARPSRGCDDRYPNNGTNISRFEQTPVDAVDTDDVDVDYKVAVNRWSWFRPEVPAGSLRTRDPQNGQLIEVNFKPGYLAPDEFLWVIESLIDDWNPTRVLVDNTAYLRMRFPELQAERMLFPALSSLTRQRNIMLIVSDIVDERGGDPLLSHGLAACADYIINLRPWTQDDEQCFERPSLDRGLVDDPVDESITRAVMTISNVRGKNYVRPIYGVVVAPIKTQGDHPNSLFIKAIEKRTDYAAEG